MQIRNCCTKPIVEIQEPTKKSKHNLDNKDAKNTSIDKSIN